MSTTQCPRCKKDFARRIRRNGIVDELLSVCYFYPFRCQFCGYRFSTLKWGVRYVRTDLDRRQFERIRVSFPATLSSGQGEGECQVTDISVGGCRLKTTAELRKDDLVQMHLQLPGHDSGVEVEAAVVRLTMPHFVGIQFLRIAEPDIRILGKFVTDRLDSASQSSSEVLS